MNSKAFSFFVVGMLVGIVMATAGFSWMIRRSAVGNRATVQVLKLAHTLDPKHPVHQAMEFMAERWHDIHCRGYQKHDSIFLCDVGCTSNNNLLASSHFVATESVRFVVIDDRPPLGLR